MPHHDQAQQQNYQDQYQQLQCCCLHENQTINENETLIIDVNATDPDEDNLTYGTNAGEVLPSPFSFNETTGLFIWTPTFYDAGEYNVTFNVTDGELWDEENTTITVIDVNRLPNTPAKPSGPTWGRNNKTYTYTTSTTDPDGDQVYYNFSWGDNTFSGWIGPFNSSEEANASHMWAHGGIYQVKVKAKDTHGAESNWSETLTVRILQLQVYLAICDGPLEAIDAEPVPPQTMKD